MYKLNLNNYRAEILEVAELWAEAEMAWLDNEGDDLGLYGHAESIGEEYGFNEEEWTQVKEIAEAINCDGDLLQLEGEIKI